MLHGTCVCFWNCSLFSRPWPHQHHFDPSLLESGRSTLTPACLLLSLFPTWPALRYVGGVWIPTATRLSSGWQRLSFGKWRGAASNSLLFVSSSCIIHLTYDRTMIDQACLNCTCVQVLDQATNEWLCVEEMCVPGKEVVVFCGKALERTTGQSRTLHTCLFYLFSRAQCFFHRIA